MFTLRINRDRAEQQLEKLLMNVTGVNLVEKL